MYVCITRMVLLCTLLINNNVYTRQNVCSNPVYTALLIVIHLVLHSLEWCEATIKTNSNKQVRPRHVTFHVLLNTIIMPNVGKLWGFKEGEEKVCRFLFPIYKWWWEKHSSCCNFLGKVELQEV
jgi:hypothetical protein